MSARVIEEKEGKARCLEGNHKAPWAAPPVVLDHCKHLDLISFVGNN